MDIITDHRSQISSCNYSLSVFIPASCSTILIQPTIAGEGYSGQLDELIVTTKAYEEYIFSNVISVSIPAYVDGNEGNGNDVSIVTFYGLPTLDLWNVHFFACDRYGIAESRNTRIIVSCCRV